MKAKREQRELHAKFPATLVAVEEFCQEFLHCRGEAGSSSDWFAAELLLREALTNAVVHGCHRDPAMQVKCRVRIREDAFVIAVCDPGEGFAWQSRRSESPEGPDTTGRGVTIIKSYSTRCRYNGRGNAVAILRRFR